MMVATNPDVNCNKTVLFTETTDIHQRTPANELKNRANSDVNVTGSILLFNT